MHKLAFLLGLIATSVAAIRFGGRLLVTRDTSEPIASIIEALPNPVYFKRVDGRYGAVNGAWESFFRIPRGAILGRTAHDLAPTERTIILALEASDERIRARSGFHVYADVLTIASGARRDVIICKASCMHEDGSIVGV